MGKFNGKKLNFMIFGESHGEAIGFVAEGIESGFEIDFDALGKFMDKRRPGQSKLTSERNEKDKIQFVSGIYNGKTSGSPICGLIKNEDAKSEDYKEFDGIMRPGTSDITANKAFSGNNDPNGAGHFSGRLTAPMCALGGIVLQILEKKGIKITAEAEIFGDIEEAKKAGDSIGGTINCEIKGLEIGVGGLMFDSLESKLAGLMFGIPGVKGIEFGKGFEAAKMKGSEFNDQMEFDKDGNVKFLSNNAGGILGGYSNGDTINFKVAIKPTPSIAIPQKTINLKTNENVEISCKGRHDPCIAIRAVPVVIALAAIGIYDYL